MHPNIVRSAFVYDELKLQWGLSFIWKRLVGADAGEADLLVWLLLPYRLDCQIEHIASRSYLLMRFCYIGISKHTCMPMPQVCPWWIIDLEPARI